MSEGVVPGGVGAVITLGGADVLWAALTAGSAVPAVSRVFTGASADVRLRAGYVVLGAYVVPAVRAEDGRWGVHGAEVRQAALGLASAGMDGRDLVRIGPFGGTPKLQSGGGTLLGWRGLIAGELGGTAGCGRVAGGEEDRLRHLAGVDWRRVLVEHARDGAGRSWWLPRAVVRLLDAAAHAEAQWLRDAQARQADPAVIGQLSRHRQPQAVRQAAHCDDPAVAPRPYSGELTGQLYSVLTRKPGISRKVAGWTCAVCQTAAAAVLDHCHEHGCVRAPLCPSCNTRERPDHLYSNDIRVAGRYTRLFGTDAATWLGHWHRCPGCRTRTALPLPHLAAWTAHTACRALRPTHREGRGRKPCGVLRVSWTGSQNAPRSCLLTVSVDFCPSGEHRVLARVSYREAADRFGAWLAETAPAVAAAAGPGRLDGLPAQPRPVIADTSGEALSLF